MKKVPVRAHLSLYDDETSALCQWHVNETHYLEHWSDARAFDGSAAIVQPLVEPLYHGHSAHDVVTVFTKRPERTARDAVREYLEGAAAGRRSGLREVLARSACTTASSPARRGPNTR